MGSERLVQQVIRQEDKEAFVPRHWYRGVADEPCTYRYLGANPDYCGKAREDHPLDKPAQVVPKGEEASYNSVESSHAAIVFTAYADAVLGLVRKKDAAYGGAWQEQGYMGNLARIQSKAARLKNMMWRDDRDQWVLGDDQETVLDTLKDLMALCAFMGANIEDGNRWGQ